VEWPTPFQGPMKQNFCLKGVNKTVTTAEQGFLKAMVTHVTNAGRRRKDRRTWVAYERIAFRQESAKAKIGGHSG